MCHVVMLPLLLACSSSSANPAHLDVLWSVCLVCLLVTLVSSAKTTEAVASQFGLWTRMSQTNMFYIWAKYFNGRDPLGVQPT